METAAPDEVDVSDDVETERFAEEPTRPTIIEAITKPEVIGPAAATGATSFFTAFRDALTTSVPLQIALAVLILAVPLGNGWWMVTRARKVRAGD